MTATSTNDKDYASNDDNIQKILWTWKVVVEWPPIYEIIMSFINEREQQQNWRTWPNTKDQQVVDFCENSNGYVIKYEAQNKPFNP